MFFLLFSPGDEEMLRELKGPAHIHRAGEWERRTVTPGRPHADPVPGTKAHPPPSETCLRRDLRLSRGRPG